MQQGEWNQTLAMMDWQADLWLLARVLLAMVLGGIIGWEREQKNHPAGFRTHMLVAGAGALLYGLVAGLIRDFSRNDEAGWLRADPVRAIEALVTGISFLGAGTIFFSRGQDKVRGLTTAASLLITGCVGLAVAMDHFVAAVGVTGLAWLVLRVGHKFEDAMERRQGGREEGGAARRESSSARDLAAPTGEKRPED